MSNVMTTFYATVEMQRAIQSNKHYNNTVNEISQQCNKRCISSPFNDILLESNLLENQHHFDRYPVHSDRGRHCLITCVDRYTDAQRLITQLHVRSLGARVESERKNQVSSRIERIAEIRQLLQQAQSVDIS